jgi:hypothetical protein
MVLAVPENVIKTANFQHFLLPTRRKTNDLPTQFDWLLNCTSTGAQGRGLNAGYRHHDG